MTLTCLTPVGRRRRSQVTGFVREKLPEAVRTSGGAGSPGKRLGAALTAMHTQLQSSAVDCEYSGCTVGTRTPRARTRMAVRYGV